MTTYWNSEGKHQHLCSELFEAVEEGIADGKKLPKKSALERYRKAALCYYDLYNNGLYNRVQLAVRVFGLKVSDYKNYSYGYKGERFRDVYYTKVEAIMDDIILAAHNEINGVSV